jgi:hypothetical protein
VNEPDALVPECLACGTCCFSRDERYVRVTGEDWARLGEDAERVAHFVGHRAFMRMNATDGCCGALAIDVAAGRFFCTIYEVRPTACRDLARGSAECAGERATKAGRPAAALLTQLRR